MWRSYRSYSSFKERGRPKTSRPIIYLHWARIALYISPIGCIGTLRTIISIPLPLSRGWCRYVSLLPVLCGEDAFSGYVVIVDCLVCRFCIYLCHEGASGSEIRVAGLKTCEGGDGMLGGVRQVGGEYGGAEVVATGGKQGRYSLLISMHRIDRGGNNIYLP